MCFSLCRPKFIRYRSNALVVSSGLLGTTSDSKSLKRLLLAPNGRLTASQLLLGGGVHVLR